jgi:hypothetical protein
MLTLFGVAALTFITVMYALEDRGRGFVLAFACGCVLASAYGFASGAWPFGVLEAIWAAVALRRYRNAASRRRTGPDGTMGAGGKVGRFTG